MALAEAKTEPIATRQAYGDALVRLGEEHDEVVALDGPAAIVCQTKKGRGVSFMEGRFGFHGKPPSQEQASEALEELEAKLAEQTESVNGGKKGDGS